MPDLEKILILKPFVDAWGMRNQRKAVKQAGKLMFWSDGMLGLLLKIAEGDKTKKTFAELKKKFTASGSAGECDDGATGNGSGRNGRL